MCFNPCRYLHESLWPLPAGATVTGWASHPPGKRAFPRRTEKSGLGHGTAVFAAIQEKAPGAELFAVRVFPDRLKTSVRALVAAIDWAAERRVRVVNLSLGTLREEHAEMLEAAVERLGAAGGVVVAAATADGQRWWPGSLPRAVGVVMDGDSPRGWGGGGGGWGGGRRAVSEADSGGALGAQPQRDQLRSRECNRVYPPPTPVASPSHVQRFCGARSQVRV